MGFDGLPSNSIWWQTWQNHLSTDATESGQRLARQNVEVDNASEAIWLFRVRISTPMMRLEVKEPLRAREPMAGMNLRIPVLKIYCVLPKLQGGVFWIAAINKEPRHAWQPRLKDMG